MDGHPPFPTFLHAKKKPCSVSRQGHRSAASNQAGLRADPLDNLAPLLRRHPPQAVENKLIHIASGWAQRMGKTEVRYECVPAVNVLTHAIESREHRSDAFARSNLCLSVALFAINTHAYSSIDLDYAYFAKAEKKCTRKNSETVPLARCKFLNLENRSAHKFCRWSLSIYGSIVAP